MKAIMSNDISKSPLTFLILIVFLYPLSICASKSQSLTDKPNEKHLTIEELRLAEETLGNPESEQYDEDKFCEVLRKALDSGILNEADRLRATYRIDIATKNRPGTTASDFSFETRSGERHNLLSFNTSKPILLLFYDPDCDHCLQTISRLKQTDISTKADVLAIYAEDDRERWEETNSMLPENWIVGYALDPIQDNETYVFITTPTLYLLTPSKTILLKDTTLPAIDEMLLKQTPNLPDKDK